MLYCREQVGMYVFSLTVYV